MESRIKQKRLTALARRRPAGHAGHCFAQDVGFLRGYATRSPPGRRVVGGEGLEPTTKAL